MAETNIPPDPMSVILQKIIALEVSQNKLVEDNKELRDQTYDANAFFIIHASAKRPRRELCVCVEISRRKPLKIAKMRQNLMKIARFVADFTPETVILV